MNISILFQDVAYFIGFAGVIFGIYQYFRNPQIAEEKKAALLAQQVKITSSSVDTRFDMMQKNFEALLLQSNNHIHTLETKIDEANKNIGDIRVHLATLAAIIDERIPKKS